MEKIVTLGHKDYVIKETDNLEELVLDNRMTCGSIYYNEEIIVINKNLKDGVYRHTLLHEIIHAIDNLLDIDLDEDKTDKIALGLAILLKQNDINEILKRE